METELYKLSHNMRVMEEVKAMDIDIEQHVVVNGRMVTIGKGNQYFLRLYIGEKAVAEIPFFVENDEQPEAIEEMRKSFLKSLCNIVIKPLSKLLKQLDSGSDIVEELRKANPYQEDESLPWQIGAKEGWSYCVNRLEKLLNERNDK